MRIAGVAVWLRFLMFECHKVDFCALRLVRCRHTNAYCLIMRTRMRISAHGIAYV